MNNENYWKQFMASGRIDDYLAYVGRMGQEKESLLRDLQRTAEGAQGEHPYAGFMYGNRNGAEPDSCR